MLSFSKGEKIALINGGKYDGKFLKMDINNTKGFNNIHINDGVIIPLPNKKIVEKIYISAPSGSGKSTYAGNYIKQYKKMFPDDEIYLFSSIDEDKALDKYKPKRILFDEDFIEDPIKPDEIEHSLCIFDDTDTIREKEIRNSINNLRDWLLEQGRHFNIRMLITSHILMNYQATRRILNEATCVVVFPKSGSGTYHIKQFLKIYCGMDKKQIDKILNLNSRWVAIYRSYPQYVLYEKGVYLPFNDN